VIELADGVFVKRHEALDLNLGLVVGTESCLVIDTGFDTAFAQDVRRVTDLPWRVVYTHNHWDHVLATSAFLPCEVWAHEDCVISPEILEGDAKNYPDLFDADAPLVSPTHRFRDHVEFGLGERTVELRHFGPSHTSHDAMVFVPDAGVLFTGDVIEIGAPVQFGPDATPENWPNVVAQLRELGATLIVPGHGEPSAEWT
jgi:glyoxylase-like metal-dependent hydrolase (beta-lactamase superfamily II)